MAAVVEAELPGFWRFLKDRHPRFDTYGEDDGAPVGYAPAAEVHEAMAETIPAYVAALKARA